jgi:hypothetical protein
VDPLLFFVAKLDWSLLPETVTKMSKVIGWKILIGELPTPFSKPEKSLVDLIKKHQADGWVLKGETMRAHPSSSVWTQRVVKYAKIESISSPLSQHHETSNPSQTRCAPSPR